MAGWGLVEYLDGLNTTKDKRCANVLASLAHDYPWLEPAGPHDRAIAIVGGGPSVGDCLADLIGFPGDIWALNGAANYLIARGIMPAVQVLLDAREGNVSFLDHGERAMRFLVSSQCHPIIFQRLADMDADVIVWHTGEVLDEPELFEAVNGVPEKACWAVCGGSTVGLKAIPLAQALGYRNFHLFGYDCSYRGGDGHAYEQPLNDSENIRRFLCFDRTFYASPWMAHQLEQFIDHLKNTLALGHSVTLYGDGMLQWYVQHMDVDPRETRRHRAEVLLDLIVEHGCDNGVGVEVGAMKAATSAWLLRQCPELRMAAVDVFGRQLNPIEDYAGWDHQMIRGIAYENMGKFADRGRVIERLSWEAADEFKDGSIDFVFIDAGHDYESCSRDIRAWLPKIRAGGFISGHDFDWASVQDAVADCLGEVQLRPDNVWWKGIGDAVQEGNEEGREEEMTGKRKRPGEDDESEYGARA